jgi:uncharacterized protein YdhG (YjbR/CyaY superfamily)
MSPVDTYINTFPPEVQNHLRKIHALIREIAPDATEAMAYGMPGYKTHGKPLIYFAGYKNHIGLYALPSGHEAFAAELAGYKQGKGSVQFPIDKPIPFELIERIIRFRYAENQGIKGKK